MGEVSGETGSRAKGDLNVLFFITVRGHGRGGHVHSLNHISQALAEYANVSICTYGTGRSPVLEINPYFVSHIYYNGWNFKEYRKKVYKLIKVYKPDILHFFDTAAYLTFTSYFNSNKYSIFVNKCGGPNPIKFPKVNNLILFSRENYLWFEKQKLFRETNVTFIPNRVNPKLLSINSNYPIQKKNAFCFVRIARIGEVYKKSIEDSIRMVELFVQNGQDIHLYLIGTIQNQDIADDLRKQIIGLPITMITEDKFTEKASDLLYLADAVIATGRGIMEAAALGKPILTPASNADLPILVTEENFNEFFATNFSERNVASSQNIKSNQRNISRLIKNNEYYDNLSRYTKTIFDENFSTTVGVQDYLKFYKQNLQAKTVNFPNIANLWLKVKTWYNFTKITK